MSSDAATTPPGSAPGPNLSRPPVPTVRRASAASSRRPRGGLAGVGGANEQAQPSVPRRHHASSLPLSPPRDSLTPPLGRSPSGLHRLPRTPSPSSPESSGTMPSATDDDVLARFARLGARQATPAATADRVAALRATLSTRPTRALLDATYMLGNAALGLETAQRREEVGVVFLQVMHRALALDQALAASDPPTPNDADAQARVGLLAEVEQCGRITTVMTQRCTDEGTRVAAAYFKLALQQVRARHFPSAAGAPIG